MSKTSSSVYNRLHGIFTASPNGSANPSSIRNLSKARILTDESNGPPTPPTSVVAGDGGKSSADVKEKKLKKKVERFKRSCESDSFRQVHGIYSAFIRRLKVDQKFSVIDEILQYQKKFEDIKSEDFVIRMILLYGYSGMTEEAHKLFDEMPQLSCERTVKSFNALLTTYVNCRKLDEAMKVLKELPDTLGITPDLVSYNIMIKGYCRKGSLDDILSIFAELEKNGFEADLITFNTLFHAFYGNGWFTEADKLWDQMESKNLIPNVRSYNAKVRGLAKHKKVGEALDLIDEMKAKGISPDVHTYNAVIMAFHSDNNLEETMKWYGELKEKGHNPDSVTYCLIIPFLCKKGELDTAVEVCKEAIERKFLARPDMFKPAINGLIKKGKVDEAMELVKNGKLQGYYRYHPDLPIGKKVPSVSA